MEADFWHQRWHKKETGWHREDVHPLLIDFAKKYFPVNSTIFIPLCGKSLDMQWLVKAGYKIIGSELSEIAVKEFFDELKLSPKIVSIDNFKIYEAESYKIFVGDFFDLHAEHLSACNCWYDRAAVIALPEAMRIEYVTKINQLFKKGSKSLLISLSYLSENRQGPPFSLTPAEVEDLWKNSQSVKLLISAGSDLGRGKGSGQLPQFKPTDVEEHAFEIIL